MATKKPLLFSPPLISPLILIVLTAASLTKITTASDFKIVEATVADIQRAFTDGELTSRQLVDLYLDRVKSFNPLLRSVLEVNPEARDQADEADRQREEAIRGGRSVGELHGVPVLLKDSIATDDKLNTTAGSYALLGSEVRRDATVVQRLRSAGAVILGKTSLTEWYGTRSSLLPSSWCARAGHSVVRIEYSCLCSS